VSEYLGIKKVHYIKYNELSEEARPFGVIYQNLFARSSNQI
jgi:hypothetical protein